LQTQYLTTGVMARAKAASPRSDAASSKGTCQAEGQRGGAGDVKRHVGKHALHQRLIDQIAHRTPGGAGYGGRLPPALRA
jgi:N-methylhydantoinase B/oxoprolinase/acetone carboxylase alpha subunit